MSAVLARGPYSEGYRHGAAIARRHGVEQARKTLQALNSYPKPMGPEAGAYAHGVADALTDAIMDYGLVTTDRDYVIGHPGWLSVSLYQR